MKSQLDMFKAEVRAFPCDRRWLEVQQAARFLNVVHGVDADKWWEKRVWRIVAPLRAAGVPEDEIRLQVLAFQQAVQIELQALCNQSVHGGAA
ncbi:DUF6074 family protein [Sinorhizobium fredii]|uniref:DUF6074 family protein n=1 Tax=Rhizobium fredii TaxID=380 RepID=UPI0004B3BC53|nr:DUF6074 family protein [Sinorhizobium fredii]